MNPSSLQLAAFEAYKLTGVDPTWDEPTGDDLGDKLVAEVRRLRAEHDLLGDALLELHLIALDTGGVPQNINALVKRALNYEIKGSA